MRIDWQKTNAAKVQETFDTLVLELPWSSVAAGDKPERSTITEILAKNQNLDFDALKLTNWYDKSISDLDITIGRFLCQRSNIRWDSKLRKRYVVFLYILISVIAAIILILSMSLNMKVETLIFGVAVPMLPLIEIIIKHIKGHSDTLSRTNQLKDGLNKIIDSINKNAPLANGKIIARSYQDQIYCHRVQCPLVFDRIYWLFKDEQENQMQFDVQDTVDTILQMNKTNTK